MIMCAISKSGTMLKGNMMLDLMNMVNVQSRGCFQRWLNFSNKEGMEGGIIVDGIS